MKTNAIIFLLVQMMLFGGCMSQITPISKSSPTWIGRPIKDIQNLMARSDSYASSIGWKENTYTLGNGNWVFVEPADPKCFIHWEVNPGGTIVNFKTDGKQCD
jgi:hypothetical protein